MPIKVRPRKQPAKRGKKFPKVFPVTPAARTALPAAPAERSYRRVWEAVEMPIAEIPVEQQGLVDTIRMQVPGWPSVMELDRLEKAGWKRKGRPNGQPFLISPDGNVKIEWAKQSKNAYTAVEASIPRLFGLPNTEVPCVDPQAFVDAMSAISWKLLPETTQAAVERAGLRRDRALFVDFAPQNGLSAIEESQCGCLVWSINRIDLARNFVGPARRMIWANLNTKFKRIQRLPSLERGYRKRLILKVRGKGVVLRLYEKDEVIDPMAQRSRRHKMHVEVLRTVHRRYGLTDPAVQQFARTELQFRNAEEMRNLAVQLEAATLETYTEGDPLILMRFHSARHEPQDPNSSATTGSPAKEVWISYRALHRFFAQHINGFGQSIAVLPPLKNLGDVAIEAMAKSPLLLQRYLDGPSTDKSKATNRKKVEQARLSLGHTHILWACYSGAEIARFASESEAESVRDERQDAQRISLRR